MQELKNEIQKFIDNKLITGIRSTMFLKQCSSIDLIEEVLSEYCSSGQLEKLYELNCKSWDYGKGSCYAVVDESTNKQSLYKDHECYLCGQEIDEEDIEESDFSVVYKIIR